MAGTFTSGFAEEFELEEGAGEGELAGASFACAVDLGARTPLFQTNFLPDLTQVKVFPETTEVFPALVHAAPALTAAIAGIVERREPTRTKDSAADRSFMKLE
jgi:hypothetical protein